MLVAKKNRQLVLNLKNPDRVLSVIPTARTIQYKGRSLVAVPHRPDEVKVLNNLGFSAPAPIQHYYTWPGRFTPFKHQKHTAEFLNQHRRAFCLNGMGSSKTLATLWAYDYLRSQGIVNKLLVVAPLSTLERTWADEIFGHLMHLEFVVLHGTREKRRKLLAMDADVYIINPDGLNAIIDLLEKREDIDIVVVDEVAQSARNASTNRWKLLNTIVNKQTPRWCWGLTGTPIPNAPTDAWAQCRLITPATVPPYYGRFRDLVMRQVTQFKWMPREGALDVVQEAMQPAIRYAREDCIDLPPTMYETRTVALTPEQTKLYKEMMNQLKTEYHGGELTAVNEAVKMSKLLQICCGMGIGGDGSLIDIPSGTRTDVVKEILDEAQGKLLVFVPFTGALNKIANELSRHLGDKYPVRAALNLLHGDTSLVEIVDGSVSKNKRDHVFQDFQKSEFPRVIVAHPGTLSHGLTLTAADTIVWFSACTSHDTYEQANARIVRPSQTRKTLILHIEGSEVERRIYTRLRTKGKVQNTLLDMLKES